MKLLKNILIIIFLFLFDLDFSTANQVEGIEMKEEISDSLRVKQYNSVSNFYPNPVREQSGKIDILVHKESLVSLKLFNLGTKLFSDNPSVSIKIIGESIEFLGNENILPEGIYKVKFQFRAEISSGTYVLIVEIGDEVFSRKIFIQR
jgi:hypothetical protein